MSPAGKPIATAQFAAQLPGLKQLITNKILPRSAALNLGIENANATAIAILDDDNLYAPEHP